ncbi:MAG TPA: SPFH domain-containing protein [Streptosporangiaceae bacterium]|nr:SPFH domain-containing protein [Streptosporangiaceae bacterium]
MAAEAPEAQVASRQGPVIREVTEYEARSLAGVPVLIVGSIIILAGVVLLAFAAAKLTGVAQAATIWPVIIVLILDFILFRGLTPVVAGEGRAVQLFGSYRGTIRTPGLHCVNPFSIRRAVSVRVRNLETQIAKVNDADGNPIEIAAVVVWQVKDTGRALYGVDDFVRFVGIQCETAVRHIAGSYAYDTRGSGELSLRDNADEITQRLSGEIANRVARAGVQIIESRLTRLSYAPEIAQAMLRQQQANAVVGARTRIVEGAVGMVQLALQRLEDEGVVQLDEERKAAMVSNLLVVLCSEQATQQVVNTGSLYQ